MSRCCSLGILGALALAAVLTLPSPAVAADRVVFAEAFTATW